MYSSVYWVSITISRFVLASVKGSDSQKMQILAVIGIINSIVSYFLIFNVSDEFGLIFMAVIFGLSNSSMYALQLTIP
jgi:fucose permease